MTSLTTTINLAVRALDDEPLWRLLPGLASGTCSLVLIWALVRLQARGHTLLVSRIVVALTLGVCAATNLIPDPNVANDVGFATALLFLLTPVLMATMLLDLRGVVVTAVAAQALATGLPFLLPTTSSTLLWAPAVALLFLNAFLVFLAWFRQQDLAELEQQQGLLMVHDRMASLGLLASGVAHEVRNPLAALSMNLELLAAEELDPELQREVLADALEGARRVATIVGDLSTLSRGRQATVQDLDLGAAVHSAVRLARGRVQVRDIVEVDVPEGLLARGSEGRVVQIVLNLVVNAGLAVAEHAAPRIRVTAREVPRGIELTVTDNGPGVPPTLLPRLFRAHATSRAEGEGTGLGLFVSRTIAQEQGGDLRHEVPDEGGARFVLTLPSQAGANGGPRSPDGGPPAR